MAVSSPMASILTGDIVERIRRLELFSRLLVEGLLAGENRSPFKGFSIDFLQHRQYFHGDNLKYLDWRVYARSDRLYVREFEQQTNAQVHIVVDLSASMGFTGEGFSKLEFALRCAAIIAYIAHLQRDHFGLYLFNDNIVKHIKPASSKRHLHRVFELLVNTSPAGETDFPSCLARVDSLATRKGIVTLVSDFMADPELICDALRPFRAHGHDLIAFHVYDTAEQELDYVDFTRFRDTETNEVVGIDPLLVKQEYQRQFLLHQKSMKSLCIKHGIDYVLLPVSLDFDRAVGDYLRHRMALML